MIQSHTRSRLTQWNSDAGDPSIGPGDALQAKQAATTPAVVLLLVEDNDANRSVLATYLRAKGYLVATASNGFEAIERTRELRPALVLMDIQMPLLNGLEATRAIRADPSISQTPIIALTALAMPGDSERCFEAGIDAYVSKPIELGRLLGLIVSMLG